MINQSFQTMKLIIQSTSQHSSTNDAEQLENNYSDRIVNDQTDDDFADPSREENNNSKAPEKASNRSKPEAGKILSILT